jgi:hypothetical protein
MADKPIKVKAYGKIVNFPAGTSVKDIESALAEHEHVLNPKYEQPSGFSGLLGSLPRGVKSTGRLMSAGFDTFTDDRTGVESTAADTNLAAERETPVEQRRLLGDLQGIDREQGVISQIGDTLKAAGRNPMGTGQMVVEQLPNTAVTLGGGYAGFKTGALAGTPFGPAGVAIGGTLGFLSGMFLGNTLIEAGSKGIQKASDEDGFTAQDKDDTIREAAIKGAVITGVDATTLKLGSVVMKKFGGAAVREGAKAEARVLMDAGVDMSSTSTINAALKSSPELFKTARLAGEKAVVGSLSRSKKLAAVGTGLALETVGEGVGEYAGEYAATGKGDVVDATIEALSSATMSFAETGYNYHKLKSGNDLDPGGIKGAFDEQALNEKRKVAEMRAKTANAQQQEQDMADIGAAGSIDEVITAASRATSKPQVHANDILRAGDPTLADIEKLTGLKPTEAIDTALDELNNPISNQPQENENASQKTQQAATTQTSVLNVKTGGIGGNGRFEALSRAYEQGTSQEYLDRLRQDAINKGVDPAILDSMSKPVLVRRISQPFDTKTLAIASNSGTSLQYSALEQANIDSDRMRGIENLDVTDSGGIALTPKNITQLKDSLGSFTAAELGSLVDKGGQLSQEGVRRVRNAMLAKAY